MSSTETQTKPTTMLEGLRQICGDLPPGQYTNTEIKSKLKQLIGDNYNEKTFYATFSNVRREQGCWVQVEDQRRGVWEKLWAKNGPVETRQIPVQADAPERRTPYTPDETTKEIRQTVKQVKKAAVATSPFAVETPGEDRDQKLLPIVPKTAGERKPQIEWLADQPSLDEQINKLIAENRDEFVRRAGRDKAVLTDLQVSLPPGFRMEVKVWYEGEH